MLDTDKIKQVVVCDSHIVYTTTQVSLCNKKVKVLLNKRFYLRDYKTYTSTNQNICIDCLKVALELDKM